MTAVQDGYRQGPDAFEGLVPRRLDEIRQALRATEPGAVPAPDGAAVPSDAEAVGGTRAVAERYATLRRAARRGSPALAAGPVVAVPAAGVREPAVESRRASPPGPNPYAPHVSVPRRNTPHRRGPGPW
ncbi:hypothetical protein SNE510_44690 [Streptomyces sp. NE5-10]|uniref:hypothetical protein n=1 Tax=Streptomyces sp. NE5-10 TaxID=2759674 RepID=UPI0019079F99|nr:hypothetical protein [Streptomyces sp. NE5-10]GHJ94950.1 hypothetical protein SNE510_44690 [Streptomyces sp. NE5-10]